MPLEVFRDKSFEEVRQIRRNVSFVCQSRRIFLRTDDSSNKDEIYDFYSTDREGMEFQVSFYARMNSQIYKPGFVSPILWASKEIIDEVVSRIESKSKIQTTELKSL